MCRQLEMECTLKFITVSKCFYTFQKFLPNLSLLGMFTKLKKATISFVMSVLSPWNNLASTGRIFVKFIGEFFENLSRKLEIHNNQTRKTGPLHGGRCTFMAISHWILGRMRNVEKIKVYILCSITFSWKSCHLWDVQRYSRVRHATGDNIIWCMCFACKITKATDIHSEYVILIAFPRQQWLCEHASMLCYMYIAHLVLCHLIFTE